MKAFRDLAPGEIVWSDRAGARGVITAQTAETTVIQLFGGRQPVTLREPFRSWERCRLKGAFTIYSTVSAVEGARHVAT